MICVRFVRSLALALAILTGSFLLTASLLAATANPIPFVNQPLVPASAEPGSAGFTVTVNGAGFVPTSLVKWNGADLSTTFVNVDQLQATVPASYLRSAGTASVTVSSPVPGGGTSSPVSFTVRIPASTLAFSTSTFFAGPEPTGLVVADFNNNGKADLAVVNQMGPDPSCYRGNAFGTVSVLLGDGDGTFSNKSILCFSGQIMVYANAQLVAGDFNGDGNIDLIASVEQSGSDSLVPFLGRGDGTFGRKRGASGGDDATGIVSGDFNGDGNLDLAFTSDYLGPDLLSAALGNGKGAFPGGGGFSGLLDNLGSMAVGDFNNDGILDLALTAGPRGSGSQLTIFLGNGDGSFNLAASQPAVTLVQASSVTTGDFDGDGNLDLAVTDDESPTITVLHGNGDGTFTQVSGEPSLPVPGFFVTTADFNGDGKLDLIVSSYPNTLAVYLGNGDGTFRPGLVTGIDYGQYGVGIGDFNGDGLLDLALTNTDNNTVSILLQTPAPSGVSASLASSENPSYVGQPVTFSSIVSDNKGVPTGSVTFKTGGKILGTVPLTEGLAVLTNTFGKAGASLIYASYSGDQNYPPKESKPVRQVVNQYTTETFLSSTPNPSTHGQPVTFTAQVNSNGPGATGKVVFMNGKVTIGSADLAYEQATLVVSNLPRGSLSITATYVGSAEFAGSTSNPLVQVVN